MFRPTYFASGARESTLIQKQYPWPAEVKSVRAPFAAPTQLPTSRLSASWRVSVNPAKAIVHTGFLVFYVTAGDKTKAKPAYKDFLTLWKDADPEIPILKQAEADYAELQ